MKTKKFFYLIGILVLMMTAVSPAAAVSGPDVAQEQPPGPAWPADGQKQVFLPAVIRYVPTFTVSGQVKDSHDVPLGGVTIAERTGTVATTNSSGVYSLKVEQGPQYLSVSKEGYQMDPYLAPVNVTKNMNNLNFTGVAGCSDPIPNPSFESLYYYWNPISGSAGGYTPYYSSIQANSGFYSGFTGIPIATPAYPNAVSWSRWRSHDIVIPDAATSADVSLYYWPQTTESVVRADAPMPDLVGINTESPNVPSFVGDFQYLAVIDASTNVILETLMQVRLNDQAWDASGLLSMLNWHGRTVKLEFGVYNDGYGGQTLAYFDDVIATVCSDDITISGCQNLLLSSDFESGTDWEIRPANVPSVYTTTVSHSTSHSMLSGIPVGIANPFPGWFTTSEFYQNTSALIPGNATSAVLKMYVLPRSSDLWGYHLAEQAALDASLEGPNAPDAVESQYGFIGPSIANSADPVTTYTPALFKWYPIDSYYWLYREFDLLNGNFAYLNLRGKSIAVLFGAINDGYNGNTALYVDDVTLDVCAP
jgi:Carboxypeptidase regulatory-like domain